MAMLLQLRDAALHAAEQSRHVPEVPADEYERAQIPSLAAALSRRLKYLETADTVWGCMHRENPVRRWCLRVVSHELFSLFMALLVIMYSAIVCLFRPLEPSTSRQNVLVYRATIGFTIVFTLEVVVKLIAYGPWKHNGYFRSLWHWTDLAVVVFGYAQMAGHTNAITGLRLLRLLQVAAFVPGLRTVLTAIMTSIPAMTTIFLLIGVLNSAFATMGQNLWMGTMSGACAYWDTGKGDYVWPDNPAQCALPCSEFPPGQCTWTRGDACQPVVATMTNGTGLPALMATVCKRHENPFYGQMDFDNFGVAMFTSFIMTTTEGWSDIMYTLWNTWGNAWFVSIVFVLHVYIGSLLSFELSLAVVWDSYTSALGKGASSGADTQPLLDVLEAASLGNVGFLAESRKCVRLMESGVKAVSVSTFALRMLDLAREGLRLRKTKGNLRLVDRTERWARTMTGRQYGEELKVEGGGTGNGAEAAAAAAASPGGGVAVAVAGGGGGPPRPISPATPASRRGSNGSIGVATAGASGPSLSPSGRERDKDKRRMSDGSHFAMGVMTSPGAQTLSPHGTARDSKRSDAGHSGVASAFSVHPHGSAFYPPIGGEAGGGGAGGGASGGASPSAGGGGGHHHHHHHTSGVHPPRSPPADSARGARLRHSYEARASASLSCCERVRMWCKGSCCCTMDGEGNIENLTQWVTWCITAHKRAPRAAARCCSVFPNIPRWLAEPCRVLTTSFAFQALALLVILCNAALFAAEYEGMSETLSTRLAYAGTAFVVFFVFELFVTIMADGVVNHFSSLANAFDTLIIAASITSLLVWRLAPAGRSARNLDALASLRIIRILRIAQLVRSWKSLRAVLTDLGRAIPAAANTVILLFIFMLTMAVVGMQLFGGFYDEAVESGRISDVPRMNFKTLWMSFVTVFNTIDNENIGNLTTVHMAAFGPSAALYFLFVLVVGNMLFLNVFLALLLSFFERVEEKDPTPAASRAPWRRRLFAFSKRFRRVMSWLPFVNSHDSTREASAEAGAAGGASSGGARRSGSVRSVGSAGGVGSGIALAIGVPRSASLGSTVITDTDGASTPGLQSGRASRINSAASTASIDSAAVNIGRGVATAVGDGTNAAAMGALGKSGRIGSGLTKPPPGGGSANSLVPPAPSAAAAVAAAAPRTVASNSAAVVMQTRRDARPTHVIAYCPAEEEPGVLGVEDDYEDSDEEGEEGGKEGGSSGGGGGRGDASPEDKGTMCIRLTATGDVTVQAVNGSTHEVGRSRSFRRMGTNRDVLLGLAETRRHLSKRQGSRTQNPTMPSVAEHADTVAGCCGHCCSCCCSSRVAPSGGGRTSGCCSACTTACGRFLFSLRYICATIIANKLFEALTMCVITWSSANLAVDRPGVTDCTRVQCGWLATYLLWSDRVVAIYFCLEMLLQMIARGFTGKHGYFADKWRWLDFIIAIVSVVSVVTVNSSVRMFRAIRGVRALRPLRMATQFPRLRLVLSALIAALPRAKDAAIVIAVAVFMFAVIGMSMFRGMFYNCNDPSVTAFDQCQGSFNVTGDLCGYLPTASEIIACQLNPLGTPFPRLLEAVPQNFDSIPRAILTVLELASGENWPIYATAGLDSAGYHLLPRRDANPYAAFYYIAIQLALNFFLIEIISGIVVETYDRLREVAQGSALLTPMQKQWVNNMRIILAAAPPMQYGGVSTNQRTAWGWLRAAASRMVQSQEYKRCIVGLLLVNILVYAMPHYHQTSGWEKAEEALEIVLVIAFGFELLVRGLCVGIRGFFRSWANRGLIVLFLGSLASVCVRDPVVQQVLRLFCVLRIFRLLAAERKLNRIVNTLVLSTPLFANVVTIMGLAIYVYAVIGMNLFNDIKFGSDGNLNRDVNFDSFPFAILTLVRSATGENFDDLLHSMTIAPPYCNPDGPHRNCGVSLPLSSSYWISFYAILAYFIMSLLVAVLIEVHENAAVGELQDNMNGLYRLTPAVAELYAKVWALKDPHQTLMLRFDDIADIVGRLPQPLGVRGNHASATKVEPAERELFAARKLLQTLPLIPDDEDRFHFHALLQALVDRASHKPLLGAKVGGIELTGKVQTPKNKAPLHAINAAVNIQRAVRLWKAAQGRRVKREEEERFRRQSSVDAAAASTAAAAVADSYQQSSYQQSSSQHQQVEQSSDSYEDMNVFDILQQSAVAASSSSSGTRFHSPSLQHFGPARRVSSTFPIARSAVSPQPPPGAIPGFAPSPASASVSITDGSGAAAAPASPDSPSLRPSVSQLDVFDMLDDAAITRPKNHTWAARVVTREPSLRAEVDEDVDDDEDDAAGASDDDARGGGPGLDTPVRTHPNSSEGPVRAAGVRAGASSFSTPARVAFGEDYATIDLPGASPHPHARRSPGDDADGAGGATAAAPGGARRVSSGYSLHQQSFASVSTLEEAGAAGGASGSADSGRASRDAFITVRGGGVRHRAREDVIMDMMATAREEE